MILWPYVAIAVFQFNALTCALLRNHPRVLSMHPSAPIFEMVQQDGFFETILTYPTGLQITESFAKGSSVNEFICLLEQNSVMLRPEYRHVYEMSKAFTTEQCENIIKAAEKYAAENGGWTTNRHIGYPTTDLPLEAVFGTFSTIHALAAGNILPRMSELFGLDEDSLRIGEMFIAKYQHKAGKQAGLGAHKDGTPWSFVVTLNDPTTDFIGGGTRFVETFAGGVTYRPTTIGSAVLFSGKNTHEGVPITSGCRYILTGFCAYHGRGGASHQDFMSSYDAEFDGCAASCDVRTGDILQGIILPNRTVYEAIKATIRSDLGDNEKHFFDFINEDTWAVALRGRPSDEVRSILHSVASHCRGRLHLVLERGRDDWSTVEGSTGDESREELVGRIQHEAPRLLSTGNFWSLDDLTSCEQTSRRISEKEQTRRPD